MDDSNHDTENEDNNSTADSDVNGAGEWLEKQEQGEHPTAALSHGMKENMIKTNQDCASPNHNVM